MKNFLNIKYLFFYCLIIDNIVKKGNSIKKDNLYISIDFGTYSSNYAYVLGKDINDISLGKLEYCPSEIILFRSSYKTKNYGISSYHSFINYNDLEKKKIIYIRNFKMELFEYKNNKELIEKNIFPFDYELDLNVAITQYLKTLSKEILKEIENIPKYKKEFKNLEKNWILTIPKIWNIDSKNLMKECAEEAGLGNLIILSELEASSLAIFEEPIISKNLKQKGKKFMLVDLGAYIVELSINHIIDNYGTIEVLSEPYGGNFGSMNIDNDIINLIKSIFGENIINNVKKNKFNEYLKTLKDIEKAKNQFEGDEEFDIEIAANFKKLNYFYNLLNIKSFQYQNYSIKFNKRKIYFPAKLIKEIIENRVNEIIDFINSFNFKEYKIDFIVLTGEFIKNKIFIKNFKKNIGNIPYYSFIKNKQSIIKGALIYGINQSKVKSLKRNQINIKKAKNVSFEENKLIIYLLKVFLLLLSFFGVLCFFYKKLFCKNKRKNKKKIN